MYHVSELFYIDLYKHIYVVMANNIMYIGLILTSLSCKLLFFNITHLEPNWVIHKAAAYGHETVDSPALEIDINATAYRY